MQQPGMGMQPQMGGGGMMQGAGGMQQMGSMPMQHQGMGMVSIVSGLHTHFLQKFYLSPNIQWLILLCLYF